VQRILENVQEEIPRAQHRAQGGRIKCAAVHECDAPYHERALARILPDALFTEYRAAQNAVMEQRLYEEGQQRFQEQLEALRRQLHNTNVARAEQDEAATAELIRRQWPNAVQCPRCHAGPVIPENCFDLQAHDGERARGGGRISNRCPRCLAGSAGDGPLGTDGCVKTSTMKEVDAERYRSDREHGCDAGRLEPQDAGLTRNAMYLSL
jgi:hypothetical protein